MIHDPSPSAPRAPPTLDTRLSTLDSPAPGPQRTMSLTIVAASAGGNPQMIMQDREDDPSRPANNTPYTLYLTPYTLYLTPYATEVTDRRIVRVPGQRAPHYIVIDLDSGFWVLDS